MLNEVLAEIEAEKGSPDASGEMTVSMTELFARMLKKGYQVSPEDLLEIQSKQHDDV